MAMACLWAGTNALGCAAAQAGGQVQAGRFALLIRSRNGDPAGGRREVEASLQGIHETLEYLAADNVNGIFWDPARRLRASIEQTLMSHESLPLLIASAEQLGRDFDKEMDTARRDEGRHRNGRGGGGGD
jgi:hypothetical protein